MGGEEKKKENDENEEEENSEEGDEVGVKETGREERMLRWKRK